MYDVGNLNALFQSLINLSKSTLKNIDWFLAKVLFDFRNFLKGHYIKNPSLQIKSECQKRSDKYFFFQMIRKTKTLSKNFNRVSN